MAVKLLLLYGLDIIAGVLIPVQAATNAMLSKVTGHALYSSLILFGVSISHFTVGKFMALGCMIIGLFTANYSQATTYSQ